MTSDVLPMSPSCLCRQAHKVSSAAQDSKPRRGGLFIERLAHPLFVFSFSAARSLIITSTPNHLRAAEKQKIGNRGRSGHYYKQATHPRFQPLATAACRGLEEMLVMTKLEARAAGASWNIRTSPTFAVISGLGDDTMPK